MKHAVPRRNLIQYSSTGSVRDLRAVFDASRRAAAADRGSGGTSTPNSSQMLRTPRPRSSSSGTRNRSRSPSGSAPNSPVIKAHIASRLKDAGPGLRLGPASITELVASFEGRPKDSKPIQSLPVKRISRGRVVQLASKLELVNPVRQQPRRAQTLASPVNSMRPKRAQTLAAPITRDPEPELSPGRVSTSKRFRNSFRRKHGSSKTSSEKNSPSNSSNSSGSRRKVTFSGPIIIEDEASDASASSRSPSGKRAPMYKSRTMPAHAFALAKSLDEAALNPPSRSSRGRSNAAAATTSTNAKRTPPSKASTSSRSPADQIAGLYSDSDTDDDNSWNPIASQIANLHAESPSSKSSPAIPPRLVEDFPAYMNESPEASPLHTPRAPDMQRAMRSAPTPLSLGEVASASPGAADDSSPGSPAVVPASPSTASVHSASASSSASRGVKRDSCSVEKSPRSLRRSLTHSHSHLDVQSNASSSKPPPSPATLRRLRKETSPSVISSAISPLASAHGTITPIATNPMANSSSDATWSHSVASAEGEPHHQEASHQPGAAKAMNRKKVRRHQQQKQQPYDALTRTVPLRVKTSPVVPTKYDDDVALHFGATPKASASPTPKSTTPPSGESDTNTASSIDTDPKRSRRKEGAASHALPHRAQTEVHLSSNSSHDRTAKRTPTIDTRDDYSRSSNDNRCESPASQISKQLQRTKTITGLPSYQRPDKSARQSPRSQNKNRLPALSSSPASMSRSLLKKSPRSRSSTQNSTLQRSASEKLIDSPTHRRYATIGASAASSPKSAASHGRKSSIANLLAAVQLSPRGRRKAAAVRTPSRSPSPGRRRRGNQRSASTGGTIKHKRHASFFRRSAAATASAATGSPAAPTPGSSQSSRRSRQPQAAPSSPRWGSRGRFFNRAATLTSVRSSASIGTVPAQGRPKKSGRGLVARIRAGRRGSVILDDNGASGNTELGEVPYDPTVEQDSMGLSPFSSDIDDFDGRMSSHGGGRPHLRHHSSSDEDGAASYDDDYEYYTDSGSDVDEVVLSRVAEMSSTHTVSRARDRRALLAKSQTLPASGVAGEGRRQRGVTLPAPSAARTRHRSRASLTERTFVEPGATSASSAAEGSDPDAEVYGEAEVASDTTRPPGFGGGGEMDSDINDILDDIINKQDAAPHPGHHPSMIGGWKEDKANRRVSLFVGHTPKPKPTRAATFGGRPTHPSAVASASATIRENETASANGDSITGEVLMEGIVMLRVSKTRTFRTLFQSKWQLRYALLFRDSLCFYKIDEYTRASGEDCVQARESISTHGITDLVTKEEGPHRYKISVKTGGKHGESVTFRVTSISEGERWARKIEQLHHKDEVISRLKKDMPWARAGR